MIQLLDPNDPKKIYSFYKDADYNVVVQFDWNSKKDKIIHGTFYIIETDYEHELKTANICLSEPGHNFRLELHADFVSTTPTQIRKELPVELEINSSQTIQFAFVKYNPKEKYDPKYHCLSYGIHIPEVIAGGVVKKP